MREVELAVLTFRAALSRLEEGFRFTSDNETEENLLKKDGVIQRFEFTFEQLWKTLKIVLESEGILCKTPTECLKEAFRLGLISDESAYLQMLKDRNRTSHLYSKDQADDIFCNVKNIHLPIMQQLLSALIKRT